MSAPNTDPKSGGIGVLNEKPLHAALKQWYANAGDEFEVTVDGYVIDIVRDDLLVEIQTRHLGALRRKLATLVLDHRVRLVHPIAQEKFIVRLARDDERGTRRRSPKRGRIDDLFWEMVRLPALVANPNFSLEVLMIREEEVRRFAGTQGWRRHGWVVEERRLLEVVERHVLVEPADWRQFLPGDTDTFTAKDVATARGIRRRLAEKLVYCLRHAGLIELVGKEGRANVYRVTNPARRVRRRRR